MSDYTVEDTIYKIFTTRAFASGVPTVLAGTPVVSAYENDSATQITAGITLGVSHDSVVGMNLLTIVATSANGYEAGKDYNLVITTGTVDGVSVVGEVVGTFSLSRSAAAVDLANATDGLGALKTLIDALNDLSAAQVNAEIVDALNTDTYAEPSQGSPGATITLAAKINYLYKAWRNRSTQTATTYALYNDDATTVDHKATVSDDATTADKGEVTTGP